MCIFVVVIKLVTKGEKIPLERDRGFKERRKEVNTMHGP